MPCSIKLRIVLYTAFFAVPCMMAQQSVATPPATSVSAASPDLAGIAHIALRVQNLDASVSFYERLGFVEAFTLSRNNQVYEAFIKINDRQFIELYPATPEHAQIGFLHLCYEGKDLTAAHEFYVQHGLMPTAVKTAGAGNLLFTMSGPASPTGPENMEYTQYQPGSLHMKDAGLHLGENRVASRMLSVTLAVDDPVAARELYVAKAGFVPRQDGALALPGGSGEAIELMPAQTLGFHSRITLGADVVAKAEAMLKAKAVPLTKKDAVITVKDPDGNEVVFRAEH